MGKEPIIVLRVWVSVSHCTIFAVSITPIPGNLDKFYLVEVRGSQYGGLERLCSCGIQTDKCIDME